jgi:putative spermidine/putrescine transport system permease protein
VGTQVNILPLLLYSKISETGSDFPAAAALSIVLMAITSAVMTLAEFFGRPGHDAPSRLKTSKGGDRRAQ